MFEFSFFLDVFFVELLVPSVVTHTLGTEVFIPYRSAMFSNGSPGSSRLNDFRAVDPEIQNYEITPFNYILYLDTLKTTDEGNYTVFIDSMWLRNYKYAPSIL